MILLRKSLFPTIFFDPNEGSLEFLKNDDCDWETKIKAKYYITDKLSIGSYIGVPVASGRVTWHLCGKERFVPVAGGRVTWPLCGKDVATHSKVRCGGFTPKSKT